MNDQKSGIISAISTPPPPGSHLSRLQMAIRTIVIAVPVLGAVPTAINLYYSWVHDVPFSDVAHRLAQYDLWNRNFDCKIDYKEISTAQGTRINVGACPASGDIAIKVLAPNGVASYEWIGFDKLKVATKPQALIDLIVGTANAAEAAPDAAPPAGAVPTAGVRLAQGGGMEVVCQARHGNDIVRVVKEGGKCFREVIQPLHSRVQSRTEVPCNTTCSGR